jgi:hypothetical protein
MNWWTVGWVAWIVWFAVEEGLALFHKSGTATLSAHVWDWFSIKPRTTGSRLTGWERGRHAILLMGGVWLVTHFMTGGWV